MKNIDTDSCYHPIWGDCIETSDVGAMHYVLSCCKCRAKVVKGFESLMLTGKSGQFMLVNNGVNFYWPNSSLEIWRLLRNAAIIWTKLGGNGPVQPRQILLVILLAIIAFALFLHIALSLIGL